jgi:hypothetical protein
VGVRYQDGRMQILRDVLDYDESTTDNRAGFAQSWRDSEHLTWSSGLEAPGCACCLPILGAASGCAQPILTCELDLAHCDSNKIWYVGASAGAQRRVKMYEWTHKHRLQQYWSSPRQGYAPRGYLRTLVRALSTTSSSIISN